MCEVPEMTMTSASNTHSQTANKAKNVYHLIFENNDSHIYVTFT